MKNILAVVLIFVLYDGRTQDLQSTIREYKKTFKTYAFSDPDPIARVGAIYPYYRFDGYTNHPENKEWTVVILENEFIQVMILPEIGGKIWGAWEKKTGRPFLYYNQVVKFRDVAMRGPWTSGGIEANYGIIGHTPNCATPVDYKTEKKADGSVSCYIGTLDLLTETYWTIEINLPTDKAYFTTSSFWYNGTPLEQSYYTWMNAGIKASGNLQFIYPGTRYIGHEGEYAGWNINADNGKDISFYEQNNFGGYKSYHVFGKYTDFFGAYWHADKYGMGRFSLHDEKAGKKIWIWGLSQQGMIWDKLLTDNDGQYVEVQSGRLFNQAAEASTFTPFKHLGFAPASTDTWTEYWFPVMDTKGFVKANPFGALNLRTGNGYLKIDFFPLQDLSEELKVLEGDQLIYSKTPDLKTLNAFSDSIAFNGNPDHLTVTLGDHKMEYRSDPGDQVLSRPVDSPKDVDWHSTFGLYTLAKENISQRHYVEAEKLLKECLTSDTHYLPALSDMAMIMYRNMDYEKSLEYARHGLSLDTYDPASNYYYALANIALGNITDAKDGMDIASLSIAYRGPAYIALSKLYFRQKDLARALHYANKSLDVNANNSEAYQLLATIYRLRMETENAQTALARLDQLNPLNHFAAFERFQWDSTKKNKQTFVAAIRNELPQETYLQLADWYLSLDRLPECLAVLNLAPENPEVKYWIAFVKSKLQDENITIAIEAANALSPELVFPFRSTSAKVMEWAISQTQDWKPRYYLALIYWSRNNLYRAKELFAQCGDPAFAPFFAARATLLHDENYEADVRMAAALAPNDWRYGKLLIEHFMKAKNGEQALATAKHYHTMLPQDFRISMLLAKALLMNEHYRACSDLLEKTTILPYEGATDGQELYREAWLMEAVHQIKSNKFGPAIKSLQKAQDWPKNLGVGRPYEADIDKRVENYLQGICVENMKGAKQATAKWNAVIANSRNGYNASQLATALAYRKLDRGNEGEKLLTDWIQQQPQNRMAKWCLDVFHGKREIPDDLTGDENFRVLKALLF